MTDRCGWCDQVAELCARCGLCEDCHDHPMETERRLVPFPRLAEIMRDTLDRMKGGG